MKKLKSKFFVKTKEPLKFATRKEKELSELVDGYYEVVELYKPSSPAQKKWKEEWLKKAKRLVPQHWIF